MGEVYTNSAGLKKASDDFKDVAEKIAEARETLYTALDNFTADMLGNAFKPMRNCTVQIEGALKYTTGRFSETSRLMTEVMYARSEIDIALGINAAGKLVSSIGAQSLSH